MKKHLYILWLNDNPLTAEHMVMMYATNSMLNSWWDKVTVIVWGAPQKLICENANIRDLIKKTEKSGVEFSCCLTCANQLNTKEQLEEYGFEVKPWGALLTDIIKQDEKLLTI